MKLLENPSLEEIESNLSADLGDCQLNVKIESYSCKLIASEKQLFKRLLPENGSPNDLQCLSPPIQDEFLTAPGLSPNELRSDPFSLNAGREWRDAISRKTLFHLISTLNASYGPYYDFSDSRSEDFSREPSVDHVTNAIDSALSTTMQAIYCQKREALWTAINKEIVLPDCAVYSYHPDLNSDPFGEDGTLWSFCYFFYNKKLKRVLFLSCRALSKNYSSSDSDEFLAMDA